MPFYDYQCPKCEKIFEIEKGMKDSFSPVCPKCRKEMKRVFYAPRIGRSDKDILNGAGAASGGKCAACKSGGCSSCGKK